MYKRTVLASGYMMVNSCRVTRSLSRKHVRKLFCLEHSNVFCNKATPVLQPGPSRQMVRSSSTAMEHTVVEDRKKTGEDKQSLLQWKPKLIIFDKNGTLNNFHNTWIPWVKTLGERLEHNSGLQLKEKFYNTLDVCIFTERAKTGLLGYGSGVQIKQAVVNLLLDEGIPSGSAVSITDQSWDEAEETSPRAFDEFFNLKEVFTRIQDQGIKIAICTTDCRDRLQETLHTLGISHLVNTNRCEDDGVCKLKPGPDSILSICEEMGVKPEDTIMIGDTEPDVRMGTDAGVGLTIGVLSGIGTRLDLAHYSDYIVDDIEQFVDMILPTTAEQHTRLQKLLVKRLQKCDDVTEAKASLVIFDKDGTLICFHTMWTPWVKELVKSLENETSLNLEEQLLKGLGYSEESQKWVPGLFAEGTTSQNKDMVMSLLQSKGMDEDKAYKAVEKVWRHGDHSKQSDELRLLDNPTVLFRILKENGVKVAICTSDSRQGTIEFVRSIGAEKYIDLIVCGDDPQTEPKPSPRNALEICRRLGVDPSRAVMVGDTIADMGMGRSAQLGATVGVLSGVGGVKDLQGSADHVVPSISHILPVIFRKTDQQNSA